jgi:hypothetical protein
MNLFCLSYKRFLKECIKYPNIKSNLKNGILTLDTMKPNLPVYQREYGMIGVYGRLITASPYSDPLMSAISTLKFKIQSKNKIKHLGWNLYMENQLIEKDEYSYILQDYDNNSIDIFSNITEHELFKYMNKKINKNKDNLKDLNSFEKYKDLKLISDFEDNSEIDKLFLSLKNLHKFTKVCFNKNNRIHEVDDNNFYEIYP